MHKFKPSCSANLICFMSAISKHTSLYHSQRFHKPLCLCTSNVL
nr:MAG TPA: hypothetical protein [Bacteriophage sp.]